MQRLSTGKDLGGHDNWQLPWSLFLSLEWRGSVGLGYE
jgi:hypothetical protein